MSNTRREEVEDLSHKRKVSKRSGSWFSNLLSPLRQNSGKSNTSAREKMPEGSLRAKRNSTKHIFAPQVQILFPHKGNVHEFTAGPNGASILDVLLPPYDFDHDRDCTFYQPERVSPYAPDSSCWLVPVSQPCHFHCISGRYADFGNEENHD